MAINRRALEKIEEACKGDDNMKAFLRALLVFELEEPGRYKTEYERMLGKYAEGDVDSAV